MNSMWLIIKEEDYILNYGTIVSLYYRSDYSIMQENKLLKSK